ncbi:MAG: DUF47 family protein [Steroidobacteraceae bacterium]|jgi:uncharacterized protein Yka (UPF0111/DUF47 family)
MKTQILAAIGEKELQPLTLLNSALAANDRIKFAFSLLQMAASHAAHPDRPTSTLKQERVACGIDDPELDGVSAGSHMAGAACCIPAASRILRRIADDIRIMATPLLASRPNGLAARVDGLMRTLPTGADDLLDPHAIAAMTQIGAAGADSLHQLVMDMHKQLYAMQADLAEETVDGAAAYGLADADRPLVSAFMKGVNRTAKVKFGHPGLATTATRAADQLVVQNDIGTTDAHVIVIRVKLLAVTVTYTDVHPERLAFFQEMLKSRALIWDQGRQALLADKEPFYLTNGRHECSDAAACGDLLEFLGSRLVFLIDWNRARKQLRTFLRRADRLALLGWAAETELGHRGFLELGGARMVNQAIEATAASSMRFGDRLCDVLGDTQTVEFLKSAFRAAADGMLAGDSHTLIHDRVRVTLAAHFNNEERQLLQLAGEHAGLIFEIATLVRSALRSGEEIGDKHVLRAARYEHDADQLVRDTREAVRRRGDHAVFLQLLEAADDAADELEDAAFLLNIETLQGKALESLQGLADLLVDSSQEWIKALGHAAQIGRSASALEAEDFLTAIDRVTAIEHEADDAQRTVASSAIQHSGDFRQLHLFTAIGAKLEAAADALKHACLILRDHVLEDVIDG